MKFGDYLEFKVKEYQSLNDQMDINIEYEAGGKAEHLRLRIEIQKTQKSDIVLRFHWHEGVVLFYQRFINMIRQEFCYCHVKKQSPNKHSKSKSPSHRPKDSSKPGHPTATHSNVEHS